MSQAYENSGHSFKGLTEDLLCIYCMGKCKKYVLNNAFCICASVSTAAPVWVARPQDSHLEEGKPGYLHCHAQANPEPEVTWLRNNIMIKPEVSY